MHSRFALKWMGALVGAAAEAAGGAGAGAGAVWVPSAEAGRSTPDSIGAAVAEDPTRAG